MKNAQTAGQRIIVDRSSPRSSARYAIASMPKSLSGPNRRRNREVAIIEISEPWEIRDCSVLGEDETGDRLLFGLESGREPVRFRLDGHEYLVEELLDQWYGPHDAFYKVRADDGNLYILRRERSTPEEAWYLVSFRQLPPAG